MLQVPTNNDRPSGHRQEYRIDSSVTRLDEIDLRRQIKLLHTFTRLLVSKLQVRRLEVVSIQPIFVLDGPGLSPSSQLVTLPTYVIGVGSVRTGVSLSPVMFLVKFLFKLDLSYFSFRPVLHDWCNKGRGMCYPVCGMMHIKESLLLIGKSSLCGGSGFPLSLSEWSFTICLTPYNRK